MSTGNSQFGKQLRALRLERKEPLTQRALAQAARIKVSNVSGMERGVRPCGPDVASRLGSALELKGQSLVEFMRLAATTTERGHLWTQSPDFERLLAAMAARLRVQGIDERRIISASPVPSVHRGEAADILAVLQDGSRAYIEIKIRMERGVRR